MFCDEDEILLEQYITYMGISKDTRDECVNLLLHSKEINDSMFENGKSEYKLVGLNLKRDKDKVVFNGSTSNGTEVRLLDGFICKTGNKYVVANNMYRLYEYLGDDERFINSVDTFTFKEDKILRRTNYRFNPEYFECEFEDFDETLLYDYYYDMVHPKQKKLKNTNN